MTLSVVARGPAMRPANIPDELKALNRWITFAVVPRGDKLDKFPYIGATNEPAKSDDPRTWISFNAALSAAEATDRFLGFVFGLDIPYTFIDFDDVLGANGAIKAYASIVVDTLDSYAEASVSGKGVHVIVRGRPPEHFTKEGVNGKVEVYPKVGPRFALLTGLTRPGLGNDSAVIVDATEQLAKFFPNRPTHELKGSTFIPIAGQPSDRLTDDELATLTEAVRAARQPGQQHHVDLAWGGICAKNGVPEDQAMQVIDALSDGEAKALTAVRDSYRRYAGGGDLSAYQDLRELMPADALAIVDGILGRFWEARRPKIVTPGRTRKLVAGKGAEAAIDSFPPPPPEVFHGWFGGYLELMKDTTTAPDQFHLASMLTIVGAYLGRRVFTRFASGKIYPNLYTVLVGNSAESRKDTAIERAWKTPFPPEAVRTIPTVPYVERNGVESRPAFLKGLVDNTKPNSGNAIIRMSEFSELLGNGHRKGTTSILTMMIQAFDNPPALSNESLGNPAFVANPSISLLAGTQPNVLAQDLIETDISSGFANRIMFVPGSGKGFNPWPDDVDEDARWVHWQRLKRNLDSYEGGELVPVNRTPELDALWVAFHQTPRGDLPMERTMSQRLQNIALKIALIFAVSDCSTTIEYVHLQRAIQWIDWDWACVRQLMGAWATGPDNRLADRILKVLERTGPIKKRDLQRKTSDPKWSPNDFARMLRSMLEIGTLAMNEEGLIGIADD